MSFYVTIMNQPDNSNHLRSRIIKTEPINWEKFKFIQQDDFKNWTPEAKLRLKNSILQDDFVQPFYVWLEKGTSDIWCLDGRHRTLILQELKREGIVIPEFLPATFIECNDKKEAAGLVLKYSSIYAKISEHGLLDFIQMYDLAYDDFKDSIDLPGFDVFEFEKISDPNWSSGMINNPSLMDRFIIPPFSIFDTRQGYWQERKRQWHRAGIDSQETREEVELIAKSGQAPAIYQLRNHMRDQLKREPDWDEILLEAKKRGLHIYEGASIFDPVLTEICYRWFCPPAGYILDPFAGGSVRGIVAGLLGYCYHGIDLRLDQCQANWEQWEKICNQIDLSSVSWTVGDSKEVLPSMTNEYYDFIFSCPPYHDLEKYSEDPNDLSNMTYPQFVLAYREIIALSLQKLKPNRFACFVVGDIRDERGFYRNFLQDTIVAFQDSGECRLYNEIILVNVAGSLPIRVGRQFSGYRKVGKMHQNVLVFYKGDPKKIKEEFPEINVENDLQLLDNQPNIALTVND